MEWLNGLEPWLANLIVGLLIVARMALGAVVLIRAGLSPLWVLLLLVPFIEVIAIWVFAYTRWPRLDGPAPNTAPGAPESGRAIRRQQKG